MRCCRSGGLSRCWRRRASPPRSSRTGSSTALDPAVKALGISKAFTGLVIVAIAGNAVENVVGITLALKGKSDLAISVVKNSVAQIACFLFPVLVLVSLLFDQRLTFVINPVFIGALALTAIAVWQITGDGEAVLFEGLGADRPVRGARDDSSGSSRTQASRVTTAPRGCAARRPRPGSARATRPLAGRGDRGPRSRLRCRRCDRMADRLAHAPHLAVPALVEHELEPGAAEPTHAGRRGRPVLELDSGGQSRHTLPSVGALDVGHVGLLDAVARMREPVRQLAVVREQERAGRVDVEPADRDDARLVADEVDDRRRALRIPRRRHDSERLVQQDVCQLLLADPLAVDLDDVRRRDERVQLAGTPLTRTRPALISSSEARREATPAAGEKRG